MSLPSSFKNVRHLQNRGQHVSLKRFKLATLYFNKSQLPDLTFQNYTFPACPENNSPQQFALEKPEIILKMEIKPLTTKYHNQN